MGDDPRYQDDRDLAARVLSGSVPAWHTFVERYSPLILSVLRRYVHDDDEVKNAWAEVLDRLYRGQLAQYAGRSRLSTWLVFVARSAAIDHVRSRRGRTRLPDGWDDLGERERFVYRELFVAHRTPDEVRHRLAARGELAAGESLAGIVAGLEERLGDRTLRRLAWDAHAAQVGAVSGRLLEYLEHAAAEAAERGEALDPERQLHLARTRRTLDRIHDLMQDLPEDERRALELRFQQGWTAERIGRELGIARRREVYTLLDRAVRNIRKMLGINILLISAIVLVFFR
ncbi:MAG: sigma-70 family RNA polymerase sigma factor [Candidatus Krumholzibacteriia bacterium]